jgi:hypothetical protein
LKQEGREEQERNGGSSTLDKEEIGLVSYVLFRRRLCNLAALSDDNGNASACMTEHLNQAIDAEAIDLPSHEIADPWLSHSEELRRGDLCEPLGLDQPSQLNH